MKFDAILLVAFGGPEKPEDILPFLRQVTAGRQIPEERLEEVRRHYEAIGGRSPLNEWTRRQAAALAIELRHRGHAPRVSCGMRNWHPFVGESLESLYESGRREVLAVILSVQDSEAGRARYLEALSAARTELAERAPNVTIAAAWHERPGFAQAAADRIRFACRELDEDQQHEATLVFTAHSIPTEMANASDYEAQIRATAAATAALLGREDFELAWQSRSGRPQAPWLEPDIGDKLEELAAAGCRRAIIEPIGFVCDHIEVLWDLDHEARQRAEAAGIEMIRAGTVADHPAFISMIADVVIDESASA